MLVMALWLESNELWHFKYTHPLTYIATVPCLPCVKTGLPDSTMGVFDKLGLLSVGRQRGRAETVSFEINLTASVPLRGQSLPSFRDRLNSPV